MHEPQDQEPTAGARGRSVEDFVNQLRSFGDRARNLAGAVPGRIPGLASLPSPPGALSAAQLRAIQETVRAQRRQLEAMRAQLAAFDQQLGVFERVLDPLVEWSSTWARLEEAVGDLVRRDPQHAEHPTTPEPPADPEPPAERPANPDSPA